MWCNHKNVACGDHLASDLVLEEVFLVAFLTTVKDNLPVFLGKCSNRASRQQGGRRRRQTIAVATTPSESNLLAEARSVAFTGGYSAGTLRVRQHHRQHSHVYGRLTRKSLDRALALYPTLLHRRCTPLGHSVQSTASASKRNFKHTLASHIFLHITPFLVTLVPLIISCHESI